ncbi:MAG TPA: transposase [Caldimonas sp.]|nr:transposase [Caldimonas sp.]
MCLTRVMHTQSASLAASEVRELWERRYLTSPRPPSANAISSAMRRDQLAPTLDEIIDLFAAQLKSRETKFAVDRTTYAAPNSRYYLVYVDGKERLRRVAREVHLDCLIGVESGIINAAMVNDDTTGESQFLIPNLERANKLFRFDELKADAGYGSEENREYVVNVIGARFYCPYKRSEKEHGDGGEWDRQWREFKDGGTAWDRRYHERSMIEARFSSDKRLHRRRVLARTFKAQRSEILAHCVVQNARILVEQFFLTDLEIAFLDPFSCRHLEELRERLMPAWRPRRA